MSNKSKGNRYTEDFKNTIINLYNSGKNLAELSSEYGIAKSTIQGWIKNNKEISMYENETFSLKEIIARIYFG